MSVVDRLKEKLVAIGFTPDYKIPFNVKMNALDILDWVTFGNTITDHSDLLWLCNVVAKIGQKDPETLECRDNFRLCRVSISSKPTERYKESQKQGCCGFYDKIHINPRNGHRFMVGFNYGH